ncbi:MAG TPA: hypothetical protein VG929_05895 [Actinomycetota bacterium]|nr:hypothetical protein [Actinomycetota bacterium]
MAKDRTADVDVDRGSRKGGYEAGPTLVSDLPPPPTDLGVGADPEQPKDEGRADDSGADNA